MAVTVQNDAFPRRGLSGRGVQWSDPSILSSVPHVFVMIDLHCVLSRADGN